MGDYVRDLYSYANFYYYSITRFRFPLIICENAHLLCSKAGFVRMVLC